MSVLDDAVPFRKLDDQDLIQQFAAGQTALLANQQLRLESTFDATQLLSRREGVVAALKQADGQRVVMVRHKSDYWQLVHQALVAENFVPISYPDRQGFVEYRHQEIPAGYQLNYDEARLLWKDWWIRKRQYNSQTIQMDLLILARGRWFPVRDLISNEGTLYVTTLVGDVTLSSTDCVAWLTRMEGHSPVAGKRPLGDSKRSIDPTQPISPSPVPTATRAQAAAIRQRVAAAALRRTPPDPTLAVTPPPTSPPLPTAATPPLPTAAPANNPARAVLSQVMRVQQGRLHIQTAVGEVVVEGANIRCWLNQPKTNPSAPNPNGQSNRP
ncbi:MAG: hypothetical protein SFW36_02405 [Leptolyngbyaceae cyanobacterium bins.59]|nr:hypothetical protein [Leptolyngbyaceae cyanobacterium bins.59]